MKIPSSEHVENMLCTQIVFCFVFMQNNMCSQYVLSLEFSMNTLLSYCRLAEIRISASEKDLPVSKYLQYIMQGSKTMFNLTNFRFYWQMIHFCLSQLLWDLYLSRILLRLSHIFVNSMVIWRQKQMTTDFLFRIWAEFNSDIKT